MTPLPGLEVTVPARREVQSSTQSFPPAQGGVAAGSSSRPEIALKSPRTAAGEEKLAAATQKRGRGEGSKGIHLEDPSTPEAAKRRAKRSHLSHTAQSDLASRILMKNPMTPTSR